MPPLLTRRRFLTAVPSHGATQEAYAMMGFGILLMSLGLLLFGGLLLAPIVLVVSLLTGSSRQK